MNIEIVAAIGLLCLIVGILLHKYLTKQAVADAEAKAAAKVKKELAAGVNDVESWFHSAPKPEAALAGAPVAATAPAPAPAAQADQVVAAHQVLDAAIAALTKQLDNAKAAKDKLTATTQAAAAEATAAAQAPTK